MGGIKLSESEVKILVEKLGGEYILEYSKNSIRMIKVRCHKHNHEWNTSLNSLKENKWCKYCDKEMRYIDKNKIIKTISMMGYTHISGEIKDRSSRFIIECPIHDYKWETCYGNLRYMGGKCKLCASRTISKKEIVEFLNIKNGTFISWTKQDSGKRNILVKCNIHNNQFKTRWLSLRKGIWCAICEDEERKIKHSQIKELVESKDGCLLTNNCSTATTLFKVKCNKDNYEWETSWSRIRGGCWCPECSGTSEYTIEEIRDFVTNKGGTLLSEKFDRSTDKIKIRCNCGNEFSPTIYHMTLRGVWCQVCSNKHTVQKDLYNCIRSLYPNIIPEYNYRGFPWLKIKYPLEVDLWLKELKLAIEYDGRQHFYPVKFQKDTTDEQARNNLIIVQQHDKIKSELISQHPDEVEYFIRFSYKDKININTVKAKLRQAGLPF